MAPSTHPAISRMTMLLAMPRLPNQRAMTADSATGMARKKMYPNGFMTGKPPDVMAKGPQAGNLASAGLNWHHIVQSKGASIQEMKRMAMDMARKGVILLRRMLCHTNRA